MTAQKNFFLTPYKILPPTKSVNWRYWASFEGARGQSPPQGKRKKKQKEKRKIREKIEKRKKERRELYE